MTMRNAFLIMLLMASAALGQGLSISQPGQPVEPKEFCQLLVTGLSDADLPAARVEWTPSAGVTLLPAKLWGGQPMLLFSARNPGKYTITITLNGWRKALDGAVSDANAAHIESELFNRLAVIQAEAANKYPLSSASCVVEVAGVNPPVPPIPPVPPVPVKGPRKIILIRESAKQTPQLAQLIVSLRSSDYWSQNKHLLLILEPTAESTGGGLDPTAARAVVDLKGKTLPAVAVYDAAAPDGAFLGAVECPATADAFVSFVKTHGG